MGRIVLTIGTTSIVGGLLTLLWINGPKPSFFWIESSCLHLAETSLSPGGRWAAERYYDSCADRLELALRNTANGHAKADDVFLVTGPSFGNPIELLFKWLNDSDLLIGVPDAESPPDSLEDFRKLQKPSRFKGIKLRYGYYGRDPDVPRDASSLMVVRRPVEFSSRFEEIKDLVGLPSIGCQIDLTALDGEFFDQLMIRLTSNKTFAHRAVKSSGGKLQYFVTPERLDTAILFSFGQKTSNFTGEPTSAAFGSLKTQITMKDRNVRPVMTPAGGLTPVRQLFSYIERQDLFTALDIASEQPFDVKIGFWLENLQVIYSSNKVINLRAIAEFRQCLSDNAIFVAAP
jgi:hypothetical protein